MRTVRWPALVALALAAANAGCSREPPSQAVAAPTLRTLVVQRQNLPLERALEGRVDAISQATLRAQTTGRVIELPHDINDRVAEGALLLRLRSTEQRSGLTQARAGLDEARARATEAQTRQQRLADMYARKVVPRAMLDEANANRDAAAARLAAARAAMTGASEGLGYTEIRAPFTGVVVRRFVEVGEAVQPGAALIEMLAPEALRVLVDIPQSLVAAVRNRNIGVVYLNSERYAVRQLTIAPAATGGTESFPARLDLQGTPAGLQPGMAVKVAFVVGDAPAIAVPRAALVQRSEVTAVYVVAKDNRTRLRMLRIGRAIGDNVEVLAGLEAGERIALDPAVAAQQLRTAASPDAPQP